MTTGKDGFRKVPNNVVTALKAAKLPGAVHQIFWVIIDRTWGFQKETAAMSLTDFAEQTGLTRKGVVKAIKKAESLRILKVARNGTRRAGNTYSLNRDVGEWLTGVRPFSRPVNLSSLDKVTAVPQSGELTTPTTVFAKETIKQTHKDRFKERASGNKITTSQGGFAPHRVSSPSGKKEPTDYVFARDTIMTYLFMNRDSVAGIVKGTALSEKVVLETLRLYKGNWLDSYEIDGCTYWEHHTPIPTDDGAATDHASDSLKESKEE